ncbi:MAG: flagellar basal body-associated FliL family protein [Thermodesulfobacteriota bacterium]
MRVFLSRGSAAFLIGFLVIGFTAGCGEDKATLDQRYAGNWRHTSEKKHTTLRFRKDGAFLGESQVDKPSGKGSEGKEKVNGTWTVTEGAIHITPAEDGTEGGWAKGKTVDFQVLEASPSLLKLAREDGTVQEFRNLESEKQEKKHEKTTTIVMKPMVVNLFQASRRAPPKYLCVELELTMKTDVSGKAEPGLHPRAHEAALLHISTLSYADVNTLAKIGGLSEKLFQILRPYFGGRLKAVAIKNVIVTADYKNAEAFVQQAKKEDTKTEHKPDGNEH